MKITKTFELKPICRDTVWYVEWSMLGTADDEKVRAAWYRHVGKNRAGKDANGSYFDSRGHALKTIREFNQGRRARAKVLAASKPN